MHRKHVEVFSLYLLLQFLVHTANARRNRKVHIFISATAVVSAYHGYENAINFAPLCIESMLKYSVLYLSLQLLAHTAIIMLLKCNKTALYNA
jgi:hypothetical protein